MVESGIDCATLIQHLLNTLQSSAPNLLLIPQQQQPGKFKTGGKTIQHLFGGRQRGAQMAAHGVMGGIQALLKLTIQQRLLGLFKVCGA